MEFPDIFSQIPPPSAKRIALRVSPAAERALKQGHPWVFDESITEQGHEGAPGDLAVIFDAHRRFLAVGLYDPTSPIRVRVLQHRQPATIDEDWFKRKLSEAIRLREPLWETDTNGYRLINGENDGFPGLVIDRYADTLVMKLYTPAWISHLKDLCSAPAVAQPSERTMLRLSRSLQKQADLLYGLTDGMMLFGQPLDGPLLFRENGLIFESDPFHGQKTGFFLDQRDNRARVEKLSRDKSVLNVFAYTGGFSVYAARGGARDVVSIDLSAPALDGAVRNMAHNKLDVPHQAIARDAFVVLEELVSQKRLFDVVIIDPPMFAQNQSQIDTALSAYRRLTKLGLAILRPGGALVQASCSSRVDAESFFDCIHQGARESGRMLTEIERTGHALDHPVRFKEGAYLKCLFALVD